MEFALRRLAGASQAQAAKEKKPGGAKQKNDPKLVAAARELRDRYLEQFNAGLVLPAGKYQEWKLLDLSFSPGGLSGG